MKSRWGREAEKAGLPFGDRTHTYNSGAAQELTKWAATQEKEKQFHDAVFHAYFVDTRNIAKADVLVDLAASVGLSPDKARSTLETRAFAKAVEADWVRSEAMKTAR